MRVPAPVINTQEHKSVLSKTFTYNSFRHTIEDGMAMYLYIIKEIYYGIE